MFQANQKHNYFYSNPQKKEIPEKVMAVRVFSR